jgi:hypothetical protein
MQYSNHGSYIIHASFITKDHHRQFTQKILYGNQVLTIVKEDHGELLILLLGRQVPVLLEDCYNKDTCLAF